MRAPFISCLMILASGCTTQSDPPIQRDEYPYVIGERNLNEAEIRALPSTTTIKDIKKSLRYFTRAAIAIPLISFELDDAPGQDCVMWFSEPDGRLIYAVREVPGDPFSDDAVVLWPKEFADQPLSVLLEAIEIATEDEKGANQALQTTSVTRSGFGKVPVSDRQRRGV